MPLSPRRRRWFMWLLLAGCYVYVSLYRLKTGVIAEELAVSFAATATTIGSIHAVFFVVYAPLQLLAGVLADRYGPRVTVAGGAIVMHVGALVFAASQTVPPAFTGRILMGLGASVIFLSTLRFAANWFRPDEFATVSGVTIAVSGIGGVLATYPLAAAIEVFGWRPTVRALALVGLAVAVAALVWVRSRPERPEEYGAPEAGRASSFSEIRDDLVVVWSSRQTWLLAVVFFVSTGVNITVFGLWGVPYAVQVYGLSVPHAAAITLLGSLGLVLGPPAIGGLSDRLGDRILPMVAAGVAFVACYGSLAVLGDPPLAFVAGVFFVAGFMIGGFALGLTVMKEDHRAEASGTATGAVNTAGFVGAAVYPAVMGLLLDIYWTGDVVAGARVYTLTGYRMGFAVATLSGIVALALTLVLYFRRREEPAPVRGALRESAD